jgi:hypothetical protein
MGYPKRYEDMFANCVLRRRECAWSEPLGVVHTGACLKDGCQRVPPRGVRSPIASNWLAIRCTVRSVTAAFDTGEQPAPEEVLRVWPVDKKVGNVKPMVPLSRLPSCVGGHAGLSLTRISHTTH